MVCGEHGYITLVRLQPDKPEGNLRRVQQFEDLAQMLRDQESATLVEPPSGMHTYDLGKHVADQQRTRTSLVTARIPLENVLARIKDRLCEFLTETEYELSFGEASAEPRLIDCGHTSTSSSRQSRRRRLSSSKRFIAG